MQGTPVQTRMAKAAALLSCGVEACAIQHDPRGVQVYFERTPDFLAIDRAIQAETLKIDYARYQKVLGFLKLCSKRMAPADLHKLHEVAGITGGR